VSLKELKFSISSIIFISKGENTMANTTMTYATALSTAIDFLNENIQYGDDFSEVVDRLKALQAQLAKRNSGSKGLTKTQKANVAIKKMIAEILGEAEEPVGMVKLIADPRLPDGMSVQKMGALLGQMVKDGIVEKGKADKHVVYSLVAEE